MAVPVCHEVLLHLSA